MTAPCTLGYVTGMTTRFDLHMHTIRHSPDSAIDPMALVRRARALGLDGVVITEHDWLWTEEELDELRAAAGDLLVFTGIEVSALEGHFLAHGVTDPFSVPRGIPVSDLCRVVHDQGGAVVAAHPFRWGQPFDEIVAESSPDLDAMELMTGNMDERCRTLANEFWKKTGWRGLGSSDAHQEPALGVCYTVFEDTIRDLSDLIDALRSGSTTPRERRGNRLGPPG